MDVIACTNGNIDDMGSLKSTWGPLLEKLQIFKNLAGTIAKVSSILDFRFYDICRNS